MQRLVSSLILISGVVLTSCTEVAFNQPVPPNQVILAEMPAEIFGVYENTDGEIMILDTKSVRLFDNEHALGAETQLKQLKDYYFLNLRDENGNFLVYFAKLEDADLHVYWFNGEDDKTLKNLCKYAEVESILKDTGEIDSYVVDISQETFLEILNAEAFNDMGMYYRKN